MVWLATGFGQWDNLINWPLTFEHKQIACEILTSNQINFIYIAQNQNHIASMGFTICTVNNILCPYTHDSSGEKLHVLMEKKKTFNKVNKRTREETSGRPTEEGSLFQDGLTCNRNKSQLHKQKVWYKLYVKWVVSGEQLRDNWAGWGITKLC